MDEGILKLIVECDIGDEAEEKISKFCRVKYSLPAFGYYVVEVPEPDYHKIAGLTGVRAVHMTARIAAQSCENSNFAKPVCSGSSVYSAVKNEGLTGKGVGVAILDTGISPVDDFCVPENRIAAFTDFINGYETPYDDNAHGTHVAGIVGGNGVCSGGKYSGIAPECNLIGVKILDRDGNGDTAEVLAGIQWVITNRERYNIRILNLSIGTGDHGSETPLIKAVEAAWDRGIVICAAAGNNGPAPNTVTSPGISRKVITVGSSDDQSSVEIWGDTLVNFSGRGPTSECIIKPDIIAPGSNIVSCLCTTPNITGKKKAEFKAVGENYAKMSGTSMSTPMVSGAVALMLQKHPHLKPNDIKYMLAVSAASLNRPKNHQGWGALDIENFLSREARHVG